MTSKVAFRNSANALKYSAYISLYDPVTQFRTTGSTNITVYKLNSFCTRSYLLPDSNVNAQGSEGWFNGTNIKHNLIHRVIL